MSSSTSASEYLSSFGATLSLIEPLTGRLSSDEAARKRLKRSQMLHTVLTAKMPAIKLSDLKTMTSECVHALITCHAK